ncbi:MAG: alpha/beta hydrolase [Deltaproteobacteria bacterium]|nr:alpha/beta hydrolase [Deltaproteobacteria bacterium]
MQSVLDSELFNRRLFFPRADVSPPPPGAEDLRIEVSGARLHLRWHRSPAARTTLLLFHGNGEVVADYDGAAAAYRKAGAELAVAEFRGYGASTGAPTLRSALDDAATVLSALLAAGPKPLVVMGRSLGSACAAELYGSNPGQIRGVVLESGFTDLGALVRRRGLPPPPAFDETDRARFDPLPKLARGALPLLVLHGAADAAIAPAEARAALEAAGTLEKTLVLIPGRGHSDLSSAELYWESLARFVREVMARK